MLFLGCVGALGSRAVPCPAPLASIWTTGSQAPEVEGHWLRPGLYNGHRLRLGLVVGSEARLPLVSAKAPIVPAPQHHLASAHWVEGGGIPQGHTTNWWQVRLEWV